MKDCIFCKIVDKELPADILYEDNNVIVFKDIKPKAPLHILIVPKKHIPSINHLESEDKELVGEMFLVAKKMAKKQGVAKTGYRLVFDTGENAGQTVDHLHLHLLGGKKLPWA
ncbi:MAG: histidine triad nucleotide-binding protein [Candidatus Nealsonbacteria bacterium CG_4_10_14_0_2_um_filter_40_15]|uniref:Histidine triad nucleotide-binding protein n=2 Tax=Candidatus Nealsoniibacteriota TaxID=1817911 RepID=A0A2M7D7L1_9BACT|nr:MAG: histidine triad nucleotide-binding protein [Candidatus Nealsonbacteria bacterium CG02_land_8_20_14_3_00_40_11]PIZ87742.1 MAG: histidine triad nucleotide-binding protein [Candidatus Nealsonbacteria bacterium CG_4_10_14_0_2_um_filter_40_15]